jgi:hypothetical protein
LSLYQSSNSEYRAGRYADKNAEEMVLNNPNLCIFGTTTEESYVSSMTREVITNGKLNRYIIIPSSCDLPDVPEYDLTKRYEISESVISGWREFAPSDIRSQNVNANLLADLNSNSVLPPLIKVSYEQTLKRIHQMKVFEIDQCRKLKSSTGPLWARYQQNALKIAMIFAIIRNKNSPVIIDQDLDIAEGIMMTSLRYATHLAENKMYENPFEKNVQDMLTKITGFGDEGVTKTELKKSVRSMQPRDFDNAVNHLIDSELIEVARATGVGRPTVKYRAK